MTFMLVFGDDMSQKLIAQNSEMQDGYEQRLQAFRAEIARLSLEMEQSASTRRRSRAGCSNLAGVSARSRRGLSPSTGCPNWSRRAQQPLAAQIRVVARTRGHLHAAAPRRRPARRRSSRLPHPRGEPGSRRMMKPRRSSRQFVAPPTVEPGDAEQTQSEVDIFVERMNLALNRAEQTQTTVMNTLVRVSESRVERLRRRLDRNRHVTRGRLAAGQGPPGAATADDCALALRAERPVRQVCRTAAAEFRVVHGMRYLVEALPITKPTLQEIRYSSPFGYRFHPIYKVQRLHAGIDMAAPIGTPIQAAGSGVVLSAGWGGGYGNLIQIDHGNGIVSRYAHLSQMDVATGQPVSAGAVIGLMGTTGASTGSHLHFENADPAERPINAACFMLAGDRINGRQTVHAHLREAAELARNGQGRRRGRRRQLKIDSGLPVKPARGQPVILKVARGGRRAVILFSVACLAEKGNGGPLPGFGHRARAGTGDGLLLHAGNRHHGVKIDAGLDTHFVQHVDHVFGRDIAGCAGRIGAAAEPAHACIELRDPRLHRRQGIRQRQIARRRRRCRLQTTSGNVSSRRRTEVIDLPRIGHPIVSAIEIRRMPSA